MTPKAIIELVANEMQMGGWFAHDGYLIRRLSKKLMPHLEGFRTPKGKLVEQRNHYRAKSQREARRASQWKMLYFRRLQEVNRLKKLYEGHT
jgi:hypothetical protein